MFSLVFDIKMIQKLITINSPFLIDNHFKHKYVPNFFMTCAVKEQIKGHIPRYLLLSINFGTWNIKHDFQLQLS